ncbi:MAG: PQQ-binding-like beta-propeller repeat protein [Melioribacteraceae bacterium]|nr:PQQ-binding-like beta-propeller repeat protein [Melioribacteraceae bacterium]
MKKFLIIFFIGNLLLAQGNFLWNKSGTEFPAGGSSWSSPLLMNNKIFWAGQDKGLAALNAETGAILWIDTLNFMNGTYDSPVGYEGKVFISRNNYADQSARSLLALDAETGTIIWQKNNFYTSNRSAKPIAAEPLGQGGKLFAASNDTLYCFNIRNGNIVWKKAGNYSNLLIDYNGMRLIAAKGNAATIEVFYPHNGELAWSINLTDPGVSISSMAYSYYQTKEYLIVAPGTRQKPIFYCIDLASKSIVWNSENIGYVGNKGMPVIYQDKVFVGVEKITPSVPQEIVAFNLLNGNILWRNQARSEGATNTPFVIALDGKVFYQSSVNNLNALVAADAATGGILWNTQPQFQNPWPLAWGSPLILKNKLYVVKDREGIFCYNAGTVNGQWIVQGGNIHATNSYTAGLVSVQKDDQFIPDRFLLEQNYPNPFNPSTLISYRIAEPSNVTLEVFDLLGQKIASLVNEFKLAGQYNITFNASDLPSGVYFYSIKAGDYSETKKMMLIR